MLNEVPAHLTRKKIENNPNKPYADFTIPELQYMNTPEYKNYLPVPKPKREKIVTEKMLANIEKPGTYHLPKVESKPFDDEAFKRMVKACRMKIQKSEKHDSRSITHMSKQRSVPMRTL